jgi:hypothetical protein
MTKELVLVAAAIATACPAAYANYDCTATLAEKVPVMTVEYKTPAGVDLDFSKGVPPQYMTKQTDTNPQLFDGDYSKLTYDVSAQDNQQNDVEGSVTYFKDVETPTQLQLLETCDADVFARDSTCMYDFVNGNLTAPMGVIEAQSQDRTLSMPMITGAIIVFVKDNAMTLTLSADKVTFDPANESQNGAQGQSSARFPLGLDQLEASVIGSKDGNKAYDIMLTLSCTQSPVPQR